MSAIKIKAKKILIIHKIKPGLVDKLYTLRKQDYIPSQFHKSVLYTLLMTVAGSNAHTGVISDGYKKVMCENS